MGKTRKKKRKTRTATIYNENNILCDYVLDMEKINNATLTDDEQAVIKALLEISKMQEEQKMISLLEANRYKVIEKDDANDR